MIALSFDQIGQTHDDDMRDALARAQMHDEIVHTFISIFYFLLVIVSFERIDILERKKGY